MTRFVIIIANSCGGPCLSFIGSLGTWVIRLSGRTFVGGWDREIEY